MASNYPGALDSLSNPGPSTYQDDGGFEHDVQHANANDAIEAIQGELGTDPAGAQATVKARLEMQDFGQTALGYWPSGGYYLTAPTSASASTLSGSANRVAYFSFWCPVTVTIDRIAVEVSTAQASANARLGIYSTSGTAPGSLLLDAGEVDCSSTGVKELTVSQNLTGGTLYWLVLLNETASVAYRASPTTATRSVGAVTGTANTSGISHVYETVTYSSGFPTTAQSPPALASSGATAPLFWLRRT